METIKDCQGKTSAKRIAGFGSLIFLAGLTVFCLLKTPAYITDFLWAWVPIICVLFGATSLEKFANLRDTKRWVKLSGDSSFPLSQNEKEEQKENLEQSANIPLVTL